jgi:hypothetical protein
MKDLRSAAAALGFVLAAACSGEKPAPAPPADGKKVDVAKAGSVSGKVLFEGTAPANPKIAFTSDPACLRAHPDGAVSEIYAVHDGGLDNVFVYVKDGLTGYTFDTPTTPVLLDQQGCLYRPHVLGLRVGQPLQIKNSDETLHNVHGLGQVNQEFNFGEPITGQVMSRTFTAKEVMMKFVCNVHTWMNAYIGVLDHPYFAVTTEGGKFALKDLPAGTYTIEAWHEKLGTSTQTVTIGEKEAKDITFTFKSATP